MGEVQTAQTDQADQMDQTDQTDKTDQTDQQGSLFFVILGETSLEKTLIFS